MVGADPADCPRPEPVLFSGVLKNGRKLVQRLEACDGRIQIFQISECRRREAVNGPWHWSGVV